MKTFRIEETFTGYAEITIEAETEEEAMALYNSGDYPDSAYVRDSFCDNYQFQQISEIYEKNQLTTIKEHNGKTYIQQWTIRVS